MKLEYDLREEQVKHLDLSWFARISSGTSIKETVQHMRQAGQNCALVMRNETLIGIFTDRDILIKVVSNPETWDAAIDTVMTPTPTTVKDTVCAVDALHFDERTSRAQPARS